MILGTQLTIAGDPIASFEFLGLPSINTHYGKHFRPRGIATNEWRLEAKEEALWFLWDKDINFPLVNRALVIVKVWVPHEGIMDVHNVYIKALLDGFTDAVVFTDDEWAFVPVVMYLWAGVGKFGPRQYKLRRTVLEIHELRLINYNGIYLELPKGRTWVRDIEWDNFMKDYE